MLSSGMPPDVLDEALRSLGMGTFAQVVERTSFWKPEFGRELDEVMARRPWERTPPLDEFVAREQAAAASREPTVDFELVEAAAALARENGLTAREAEVMLLNASMTDQEIAEQLGISRNTVKATLHHARKKIEAKRAGPA